MTIVNKIRDMNKVVTLHTSNLFHRHSFPEFRYTFFVHEDDTHPNVKINHNIKGDSNVNRNIW